MIIAYETTKVADGFTFIVYSFGHSNGQRAVALQRGRADTRAEAARQAKKWVRHFKSAA